MTPPLSPEQAAVAWMKDALLTEPERYLDGAEVNRTKLAEDCAEELDFFEEDDDIEEWVFDVAHEVAEEHEDERCIACGKPGDRLQASGAYSLCGPCEALAKEELRS